MAGNAAATGSAASRRPTARRDTVEVLTCKLLRYPWLRPFTVLYDDLLGEVIDRGIRQERVQAVLIAPQHKGQQR
jgi:hypothetical protein